MMNIQVTKGEQSFAHSTKSAVVTFSNVSRRQTAFGITSLLGLSAASVGSYPDKADAAYGEAARVFSPSQEKLGTDYQDYQGQGYTVSIPQRGFNPTKKGGLAQFPNTDVMWEDMMSTDVATVSVSIMDKGGLPDLKDMSFLFGKDVWDCEAGGQCTDKFLKEQGFTTGSAVGHIMKEVKAKGDDGTEYVVYDVLTRYQDGSQGGRWHLIKAASKGGKQYIAQFVGGEKHWAHNKPIAEAVRDSFRLVA